MDQVNERNFIESTHEFHPSDRRISIKYYHAKLEDFDYTACGVLSAPNERISLKSLLIKHV